MMKRRSRAIGCWSARSWTACSSISISIASTSWSPSITACALPASFVSSDSIERSGVVGEAPGLLQIGRHDDDRELFLELVQKLLDPLCRNWIERTRRLVE